MLPDTKKKTISIFTPCYNEEANVEKLITEVKKIYPRFPQYNFEHVFIDNSSTDNTVAILRKLAANDKQIKVIVNVRNFGHIRSPYYGLLQCTGDAVISLVADLQDPPDMIPAFIEKWEEGFKIIIAVKSKSEENPLMFAVRGFFYTLLNKLTDSPEKPVKNFTGFGLYDQQFLTVVRGIDDPYPYFRGMISELGFRRYEMEYTQQTRQQGKSKNNFFTLYDLAMLGFTNHSKLPLRLSVFVGIFSAILSLLVALGYLVYKLIFWDRFQLGLAPLV
ncbi:MAG: glycosyltransferase, partial [Chitinophagia bacterium]|nr:glycosyltransferase [Chitinophagia bacterium]